ASGRLMLAFYVLGERLPLDVAIAAAAAGMLLAMAGVTPNGLGMKEWAVAALAATQTAIAGPVGLAAAILDRAAEAIACLLVGGPSVVWLGRGNDESGMMNDE